MSYLYAHDNPFTSREAMLQFADFITGKINIARRCKRAENAYAESCSGILTRDFFFHQAFVYQCEEKALKQVWQEFLNSLDDYAKFDIFQHFKDKRHHRWNFACVDVHLAPADCPF